MANKTSTIHLRVEPTIKADVEKLLNRLGLSTTDAINIFLNQIVPTIQPGLNSYNYYFVAKRNFF